MFGGAQVILLLLIRIFGVPSISVQWPRSGNSCKVELPPDWVEFEDDDGAFASRELRRPFYSFRWTNVSS